MLWTLVTRLAWREKQNREFRILGLALWLAIFAVTVLSCLADSLHTVVNKDAANLLGADLIAEASQPISSEIRQLAEKEGLQVSSIIEFFSMVINNGKMQLTDIEAIADAYPLRGDLTIQSNVDLGKRLAPPSQGEIWCDEDLIQRLDLHLMDKILLGDAKLIVTGIIRNRPVATSDSSVLAPLAYVNAKDLPMLGVLQPGSRATYRLLFAGTPKALAIFRAQAEKISSDLQWITTKSGRPALSHTLTDVEHYVAIILLIQVVMAGIAIAMCAQQYSTRQREQVAIWRCLGASSASVIGCHVMSLCVLGILVMIASIIAGYAVAYVIAHYVNSLGITVWLGYKGGIIAIACGLIMLLGFALPPLVELRKVSAVQIIQHQNGFTSKGSILCYIASTVSLGWLFTNLLEKEEIALTLSFAAKILGLGLFAFIIIYILGMMFLPLSRKGGLTWRLGMSYLGRYQWQTISQWLVFTMVLMLLLLVQILRYDFINIWQAQLSKRTPNYFLINIQPDQVKTMQAWFTSKSIQDVNFYPLVRGRMLEVNGIRVGSTPDPSAPKGLNRALNLTWMRTLPQDNQIVSGIAWDKVDRGQAEISVEKGFADRQHLKLGDSLRFEVADQQVTGKIVSFRIVDWGSFKPNFFVIFPPGVIDNFPHSYFTSVYLTPEQKPLLWTLAKSFVEVSIIDIDAVLGKVRDMVNKLSFALNGLLVIVLILGVLIMYANLISTLKERLQESAMLRILGANKKLIIKMLLIEFSVLGFLSGIMASVMALILAQEFAQNFLDLPFVFHLKWLIVGSVMGVVMITLFGLFGAREIFKTSPLWLFRQ